MKLLRCDFGAFCTAILVAIALMVTVPTRISFHSKLNPVLQKSASLLSCAVVICQRAKESKLSAVQESQSTMYQAVSESFSESLTQSLSQMLPNSLPGKSSKER